MAHAARTSATYADLCALPEDARAEVLAGELVGAPRPSGRHSRVQRSISRHIGGPFDDDDGHDRVIKRALYAHHGVPYYWIVDPQERVLECLQLADGGWLELGTWGDGDEARIAPFTAVSLEVSRLFPPLR